MDPAMLMDRILEDERMIAGLEGEEATLLFRFLKARSKGMSASVPDEETAWTEVNR